VLGGAEGLDPTPAVGISTTGLVDCDAAQLEAILISLEQDTLYPENYTSYARTYTSDDGDFTSGATTHLSWTADYGVEIPFFGAYEASILGGRTGWRTATTARTCSPRR